jgi:hypothetical protein
VLTGHQLPVGKEVVLLIVIDLEIEAGLRFLVIVPQVGLVGLRLLTVGPPRFSVIR